MVIASDSILKSLVAGDIILSRDGLPLFGDPSQISINYIAEIDSNLPPQWLNRKLSVPATILSFVAGQVLGLQRLKVGQDISQFLGRHMTDQIVRHQ